MKKHMTILALLMAAAIAPRISAAWSNYSIPATCSGPSQGGTGGFSTYMCSWSSTTINVLEAAILTEIGVTGTFQGPGYFVQLQSTLPPSLLFPFSWMVTVHMPWNCAYSGAHSAGGRHWGTRKDPDLPPIPLFIEDTLDFHVQWYCDCSGHVP